MFWRMFERSGAFFGLFVGRKVQGGSDVDVLVSSQP